MTLGEAQQVAQLFSIAIYVVMAVWYFAPWSRARGRADALVPLLWVQAFRYVALQIFSAQIAGFPISDVGRDHVAYGDVLAACIALGAIVALRYRARAGIPLAWLLVVETVFDFGRNVHGAIHEHLFGLATGTTWFLQTFYVPLVVVTAGTIVWQLVSRNGEALAEAER